MKIACSRVLLVVAMTAAVAVAGCGDTSREADPGQAQASASGGGGDGGGWSAGTGGDGSGAGGGAPASCDALVNPMPPGESRWYLDASPSAILPLTSELVVHRGAGSQTTLVALARTAGGATELVLSTFDGAAVQRDLLQAEPLPLVRIPLEPGLAPTRLSATAGNDGQVLVVIGGDGGTRFLRIDEDAVIESRDIAGVTEVRFLVADGNGQALFGVQPPDVEAPLTLLTGKESSIDEGYPLGCDYWFTPASAVPYGDEVMLVFSARACPELGDDGLYMVRIQDGKPDSDFDRLDIGFDPWVPELAVVGGAPWLVVAGVDAGYSPLHARALHPSGWVIGEDHVLGTTISTLPALVLGDRVVTGLHDHTANSIQVVSTEGQPLGSFVGASGWESVAAAGDAAVLLSWKSASPPLPDDHLHVEQLACGAPR